MRCARSDRGMEKGYTRGKGGLWITKNQQKAMCKKPTKKKEEMGGWIKSILDGLSWRTEGS